MMACCLLCYKEYLRDDGTVDDAAYEAARLSLRQLDSRGRLVKDTPVQPGEGICMCDCHKKDSGILH